MQDREYVLLISTSNSSSIEEEQQKRPFVAPKLSFVTPKLTKQGQLRHVTAGTAVGDSNSEP